MIVYVESNFILELAYMQEEHASCEGILALSEGGEIRLVLPAFCIGEPYEAWARRAREREAFRRRFEQEMRELSRSQPYSTLSQESQAITRILIQSGEDEKRRLDATIVRIVAAAAIIPLDYGTIQEAIRLQSARTLSPQDAIVYSSILSHMAIHLGEAKCFLTKNARDFADPDIEGDLQAHSCKLLTRFTSGLGYALSQARA